MISSVKEAVKRPLCTLLALSLALAGCTKDDDTDSGNGLLSKAKLSFKVYECQSPLKAAATNEVPAAQADIKIYSKTYGKYTLLATLTTNDKGEAEYAGGKEQTVYYEVNKGTSTNLYEDYIVMGIFTSEEDIHNWAYQGIGTEPGDLKLKDVNYDGVINKDDQVPDGYASQTFESIDSATKVTVYIATPSSGKP